MRLDDLKFSDDNSEYWDVAECGCIRVYRCRVAALPWAEVGQYVIDPDPSSPRPIKYSVLDPIMAQAILYELLKD